MGTIISTIQRASLPENTSLAPNEPNPFNPRTTLRFELAEAGSVRLAIHDLRGRRVRLFRALDGRPRHGDAEDGPRPMTPASLEPRSRPGLRCTRIDHTLDSRFGTPITVPP